MKLKKLLKQKSSLYVYGVVVALCVAMFLYGLVKVCMFSKGHNSGNFENVLQMIFSAASILIISIYFSLVKFSKLEVLEPLNIYFTLFLFVFFGVYPCFGLFANKIAFGFFFAFLGVTIAIISISLFFHFSKGQNGTLRANPWFLALFQIAISTFVVVIIEILMYFVAKASSMKTLKTLNDFLSQIGYSLIGIAFVSIITVLSLFKSKIFVNQCLVRKISD